MLINSVKRKYEDQLLQLPNVCGVGIGKKEGRQVIKVFVSQKIAKCKLQEAEIAPKMLDGYETDVEEIGDITAEN